MQLTTFFHSYPIKKLNFQLNQSRPYYYFLKAKLKSLVIKSIRKKN